MINILKEFLLEFYDGYHYRICVVGSDSTIIVDSEKNTLKGNLLSSDNHLIVDIDEKLIYGSFIGNVYSKTNNLILDTDNGKLDIERIDVAEIYSKQFRGDFYGKFLGSAHGDVCGNVYSTGNHLLLDAENNTININRIDVSEIYSNKFSGNFYGNIHGNIYNKNNQLIFNYVDNEFSLNDTSFKLKVFNNYNNEIMYTKDKIGFTSSKKFNFNVNIKENLKNYDLSKISHVSILNSSSVEDRDSAGMIEFLGLSNINDIDSKNTFFGSIGFIANTAEQSEDTKKSPLSDKHIVNTDFVVINGRSNYEFDHCNLGIDFINKNMLVFDTNGTLSAPVIKTGVYADVTKILKPKKGMIVFNDNLSKFQGYTGSEWVNLH